MIQIGAELSLMNRLFKGNIGGGNNAHIDLLAGFTAHRLNMTIFKDTQQFALHLQRHFTNFIQKKGTMLCLFKMAAVAANCASKGPLFVAEKFRFEQLLTNCAAIDRGKRSLAALTALMQSPGNQLLAAAGFPGYNHSGLGCGVKFNFTKNFTHGRALTNQPRIARFQPAGDTLRPQKNLRHGRNVIGTEAGQAKIGQQGAGRRTQTNFNIMHVLPLFKQVIKQGGQGR